MEVYRFLLSSDTARGGFFVLLGVIGGLLQSSLAYQIGLAAEHLRFGIQPNAYRVVLFVIVLALLGATLERATTLGLAIAERAVGRLAIRLAGQVRDAELCGA